MQSKSQKAEISDASEAQGVSGHSPKRVWLRIVGGGMTLPSGKSYITLVGDDREMPKHVEYVRADLTGDLVKALEEIAALESRVLSRGPELIKRARHIAKCALASSREVRS